MAPIMLLLLAGVLNYSIALRTSTAVANAARSGAQYGSRSPAYAADTAGIQSAAVNSAPDVQGMAVTSLRSCQCSDGNPVSCSGTCASGKMLMFVQVTAQASLSPVFHYSRLPFSASTSTQATLRVQ